MSELVVPNEIRVAAPGPPWDSPIDACPLAFLDLEMTGLDVAIDRVIEVAVERVVGGVLVKRFASLVRPDDGRFGNAHVHGISQEDLASAPTFAAIADELLAILDGAVPVAHGSASDRVFLEAELARAGRPTVVGPFVDTLHLARRAFAAPSHALGSIAKRLGLPTPARSHRALDDVQTMRGLYERCVGLLAPATPRDLLQVRVGEGLARDLVLARAAEALAAGVPVRVTYRAPKRQAEDFDFVLTELRAKLDPPVLLGYLHRCRSRKELRADRVLAIVPAGHPYPGKCPPTAPSGPARP
jgi:DNA polymerase-3 subunit epsilon